MSTLSILSLGAIILFSNNSEKRVAVLDLVNPFGQTTALSSYLSDDISIQYSADTNVVLIERGQVSKIISEQGFQASGAYDEKTIASIGKLCGATEIVIGKYYPVGDNYEIIYREISVQSGKVTQIKKKSLSKTESLVSLDKEVFTTPKIRITPEGEKASTQKQGKENNSSKSWSLGPVSIDVCTRTSYGNGNSVVFECTGTAYSDTDGRIDLIRDETVMYMNNGARGGLWTGKYYVSNVENAPLVSGVRHKFMTWVWINDQAGVSAVQKSSFALRYNGEKYENTTPLPFKF